MSEVVPVSESTRTLADCEAVIRRGLNSFIEVGEALMEIRDNRLYREKGFGRFEDYCQQEWGWKHSHAYKSYRLRAGCFAIIPHGGNAINREPSARAGAADAPGRDRDGRHLDNCIYV